MIGYGYPVTKVLKILKLNKLIYYYNINKDSDIQYSKKEKPINMGGRPIPGSSKTTDEKLVCDDQIKEYILEIAETEELCYGYYKITIILRRKFKLIINKKKVYRLCKELGVLRPQREIKPKYLRKINHNREITKPDSLWEVDIKYSYTNGEGMLFYITFFIDVYHRNIIEYRIRLSYTAEDIVITLKRPLMKRNLYNQETT